MNNVQYLYGTKRVRQALGTIYRGDFEGDFGESVNRFANEYASYKKYLDEPHEFGTKWLYGQHMYLDGTDNKMVQFDKLMLDWQDTYDDEKELRVIGERDMDSQELAAMEIETEKQVDREKEQLRKLKEKYPNG
jgi:hypothetical protein